MKPGYIAQLQRALASNKFSPNELANFFKYRIDRDRKAVGTGQIISDLNLPATNSVVSCSRLPDVVPSSLSANLGGIPFLVKDNFCIDNDIPTTCASKMLANFKAPYTAPVSYSLLIYPKQSIIGQIVFSSFQSFCMVGLLGNIVLVFINMFFNG